MGPEQIGGIAALAEVWRTEAGCANHPGYFGRSDEAYSESADGPACFNQFRRRSTSEWIFLPRMFTSPTTRCLSPRTGLMIRSSSLPIWTTPLLLVACATDLFAQRPPYDVFPPADPPTTVCATRAGARQGELVYPVNYTIWIPKGVKTLRGVIVHQHGCGEGSCKSGLTGAYDLHWQALARKHDLRALGAVLRANRTRPLSDVVRSA